MIKIIDLGCSKHHENQVTLLSPIAEWVESIIYNMQKEGDFYTFICNHGHTHHVSFRNKAMKVA